MTHHQNKPNTFLRLKTVRFWNMSSGIAIAVGGRFHSDFMAAALAEAGFDTRCYTSFPGNRFGSIRGAVHSFVWPEVVFRVASKAGLENWGDLLKMQIFGRWLSRRLKRRPPQVLIAWSSF